MLYIAERNVNYAWPVAVNALHRFHTVKPSRAGETIEYPTPAMTMYTHPTERVLFDAKRDANPFFHLMESLWMLVGSEDVHFLEQFAPNFGQFSDDGDTLNGAYGYRWKYQFGYDQLTAIVSQLRNDPYSRRVVLQMWAPHDLQSTCKDVCCNTNCYFLMRDGKLSMTVCCRSNDIIWGCYGANVVHFSYLLEYVASMAGLKVGTMYQLSNSFHAYTSRFTRYTGLSLSNEPGDTYKAETGSDEYSTALVFPYPLIKGPDSFDRDLLFWYNRERQGLYDVCNYDNPFFSHVATPMRQAWNCIQQKQYEDALIRLTHCYATDWRRAGEEWIMRRINAGE